MTCCRSRHHESTQLFFWRQFLLLVLCKYGTGFVWYHIHALIKTLLYSKPDSGMHVTEMMTYFISPSMTIIVYVFVCFLVLI